MRHPITITCRDGLALGGHRWQASAAAPHGLVVINPATGVLARYYHRYARFLADAGFDVLTYDYRGIGLSRPARLRGCGYRWRDWGHLDCDAALRAANGLRRGGELLVVGHSVGGFLPGLAESGNRVDRMLTVGAQYGFWRDYAPDQRLRLFLKWHVAMPAITGLLGYFPGSRLGWLEDLPAGVAREWAFKRARTEASYPAGDRDAVLAGFERFQGSILAVVVSDDSIATRAAIDRSLRYYTHAAHAVALVSPADPGTDPIGHFGLFHAKFADSFWAQSLLWLRDGINPWIPLPIPMDTQNR